MVVVYVYRSNRKLATYLYMKEKDDFECLPEAVLKVFGTPEFSMSFILKSDRKLAQVEAQEVLEKLEIDGYYLQLPKTEYDLRKIEEEIVESLNE